MRALIFCLWASGLFLNAGCASEAVFEPVIIPIIPTQTAVQFSPQGDSHALSTGNTMLSLQNVSAVSPIRAAELDPLTDYIRRFHADPVMTIYVEQARVQRDARCAQVRGFYLSLVQDTARMDELATQFSYSCPCVVAEMIELSNKMGDLSAKQSIAEDGCKQFF